MLLLDHSECDGDNTWEALDDNVMDDPEDETLDALDEYFDSQGDDVTLDAPESQVPNSTDGVMEDSETSSPSTSRSYSCLIMLLVIAL